MQKFFTKGISLRTKIILPYLVLALLLAIGAAYIATRITADSIGERFVNQLIEAGKLSSEWMVKEENRLLETLRLIAFADGVSEAIVQADAEQLRELVYPIAVNSGEEAIDILDTQGVTLLSLRRHTDGKIEDYDFSRGETRFRDLAWVRQILQGEADSVGDKYVALVSVQSRMYLYIGGPIFDHHNNRVGVVLVAKSLTTLAREMREVTLAQVSFYDSDGHLLATTYLDPQALSSQTFAEIGSVSTNASLVRDSRAANIEYSEIIGLWQVRNGAKLGWLGVAFAKNFLVRLSQDTWIQILASVVLGFLLVLSIGWLTSDRISKPILQLERAAIHVAEGDLGIQVIPRGNDEVAQLTAQFNTMVASLATSKQDLLVAYDMTIAGWAKALDMRDRDTENHSQRVTDLTVRLSRAMGIPETRLDNIRRGALLHDIGKMAIPDQILLKPGALDQTEWAIMRKHPLYAMEMIKDINFLSTVIEIPVYHHEHWDGSGYPFGLKGDQIPLAARIFSVVDVWDALRSARPYRPALSEAQARQILNAGSGKDFDAQVVSTFFQLIDNAASNQEA